MRATFLLLATTALIVQPVQAQGSAPEGAHDSAERHRHGEGPRFLTDRSSPVELELPAEEPAFQFAVFGDRTGGPAEGIRVLAEAVDEVNLVGPDLVLTVGDLIQGYNEAPQWLEQMREFKGVMAGLDCPWFPVAGNHDVYWRGPGEAPEGEHEALYELHFGPLWYALRHKSAWFLVLYTDEGNPRTGAKTFGDPDCQRMSPEQFSWLKETLGRTAGADHVFVFVHHPRWIGGNYGDDWNRVHAELVSAGNVSAVFGGHIHRMRYDGPRDGIEYFTLATTGGGQSGVAPRAGYLHHYDLVTVRKDGISVVTYPVGSAIDPRAITAEVSAEVGRVASMTPRVLARPALQANGSVDGTYELELRNPASRPVEIQAAPVSSDSRWAFLPDHAHFTLEPGATRQLELRVLRRPGTLDEELRDPQLSLAADYLAQTQRIEVPARTITLPLELGELEAPGQPRSERALDTDSSGSVALVPAGSYDLPDGPLTLEGRVRARSFSDRTGWLARTENSEYGIFLNNGHPTFSVHLGGRYISAEAPQVTLETGRWYHVAGVFDGAEVRLYVDGQEVARAPGSGTRTRNQLPLVIGGDVAGNGRPTSTFDGWTDEVRLSRTARYRASFRPELRHEADADTVLLLHMDGPLGPWLFDSSASRAHASRTGEAAVVEAP